MTAAVPKTAVGVFKEPNQAEAAVAALHRAGFGQDQVGLATRKAPPPPENPPGGETKAAEGGIAGALTGGVLGTLLGTVAIFIPGIGHVVGLGILAAVLGGATAGVVAGSLVGLLIGMGLPEEEANYYQGEFEAGRTIVTIKAGDRYNDAIAILRRHGAYGKGSPLI